MASTPSKSNGIYYFLGNITSHILHALPLYKELGGTFIVLSKKAAKELRATYDVPVVVIDNKPNQWIRFGYRVKPIYHYLHIGPSLKKTCDYLEANTRVVIFYELYDFAESVQLQKPKTIFLTHGNMLKNYMQNNNRLEIIKQYDYMAAVGPYLKRRFIEVDGIDPAKLIDLGLARTDEVIETRGKVVLSNKLAGQLGINNTSPIFAYLPTFWGTSSVYDTGLEIVRNFPAEYILIFRPHPQTSKKILRQYKKIIAQKPNVIYAPEGCFPGLGLLEIFLASSVIIGDVSSVMAEAILLEKPLLFAYGTGSNVQPSADYDSIREVVNQSLKIDGDNTGRLAPLLKGALSAKVDKGVWESTADTLFFDTKNDSTKHIVNFIQSL